MTNGPVDFSGSPDLEARANEIADDEEAHVIFLRSALGADAVDRPNLDLRGGVGGAFGTAARAAGETAGITDTNTLDVLETRGALGNGKDQSIVVDGKANIVASDDDAIAFSRSPREVLDIVFAGGSDAGLFFPDGVNGDFSALL